MGESTNQNEGRAAEEIDIADHVEEFADGEVSTRHGRINGWLMAVYAIMFVWAIYYGITYWGGLGPGLDY